MFSHMEYVYAVCKHRSFSKAAESLYISQPALSLTIKKVEARVGSPLFDRSTNPVRLTECGEEYIKCIEHIMDIQSGFENYLGNLNGLKVGNLIIGASNFFTSYILPPIITRFKTQYPEVSVNLMEGNTADLERQLFEGSLDLVIDNNEFSGSAYKKQFFFAEKIILAMPKTFLGKRLAPYALSAGDIAAGRHLQNDVPAPGLKLFQKLPFILLRHGNDTRTRADKIFSQQGITPQVVLELDQLATAFHVAYRGLGITFASDTLTREISPDDRMVYFKLEGTIADRNNYFHYKHNKYLSRSMEAFLALATSLESTSANA